MRFRSFFSMFKNNPPRKWQTDPVCGMQASDEIALERKGTTHFFCSDHCKRQFEKDTEAYIGKKA